MDDGAVAILPYCISYGDNATAYLGPPSVTQDDGELVCDIKPLYGGALYGSFYAVSPLVRPIPYGMQLYCAERADSAPYTTVDVKLVYDIFDLGDDNGGWGGCTMFMAYPQPVPNTVPLYLHKKGDSLVPSFEKEPPTDYEEWGKASGGSPIYVMTPESVGMEASTMNDTKFKCVSGRCLPWIDGENEDLFGVSKRPAVRLRDCVVLCDELYSRGFPPTSVLNVVERDSSMTTVAQPVNKIPPWGLGIVVGVFVLVLLVVLVLISGK